MFIKTKQIKQLEEENRRLKEDYRCLDDAHLILQELYDKLAKRNNVLEKEIMELKKIKK